MKYFGHVPLCNHRADRGIFIGGFCLPLCARCTGIVAGALAGIFFIWLSGIYLTTMADLIAGAALMVPTAVDGIREYRFGIESSNVRRLITGLVCGIGCAMLDQVILTGIRTFL